MSVLPTPTNQVFNIPSLPYSVIRELMRRLQRSLRDGRKNSIALGNVNQTC
jgi:hypothetical protein